MFSKVLLTLYLVLSARTVQAKDAQTYDYIVIGGGTAGLALSTRLSQSLPSLTILVLEAGPASPPNEDRINIPGRKGSTLGTLYDWNFTTVPQPALNDRVVAQNRGRVLGGTSAVNLLTYDRASSREYDGWEEVGNPGWGWRDFVLGGMMRAENFTAAGSEWYDGGDLLGTEGPIRGEINRWIPEHQEAWIPTMRRLGVAENRESMGGDVRGVFYGASSINPTTYNRSYSANEYLPLAGKNLEVRTETRVSKINLRKGHRKGAKYRATGVTLEDGTVIDARKEVIISAGTFQSPGLLEASGIGGKAILGKKLLINLPGVGENLQDHVRIQSAYQLKDSYTSFDRLRYDTDYAAAQFQLRVDGEPSMYDYTGSGYAFMNWADAVPKSTAAALLAAAKEAVGSSTHPTDAKKLEWMSDPTIPQLEVIISDGYTGLRGYPAQDSSLYGKGFFSLIAAVMHPLSRGSVHINPSSPLAPPIIDPKYLSNPYDLAAAIEAIKFCRRVATTPPLADVWTTEYEPGPDTMDWEAYVRSATLSIYHPVGTCSMLPRRDGGVVDPSLRVYSTENLRVVDASIMPVLVSAHIQTAVYGIAEMAASMIIDEAT